MQLGTPVVAVNSGGPTETVVDGVTGFLCEQTAEAFSRAMFQLVSPVTGGATVIATGGDSGSPGGDSGSSSKKVTKVLLHERMSIEAKNHVKVKFSY